MSDEQQQPEPQPNPADLIDALADYYAAREGVHKAEAVSVLTAMSPEKLRTFADMTMAEVKQQMGEHRVFVPRSAR